MECKQLHHFHRECDEVEVWIVGREAVAASEELGKDLEHVEVYSTHTTYLVLCSKCISLCAYGQAISPNIKR